MHLLFHILHVPSICLVKNVLDLYRDGVWALVTMILSSCCVWTETTDSSSTIAFLTGFTVLRKSVTFEGWTFQ